jgi:hypothetical protein
VVLDDLTVTVLPSALSDRNGVGGSILNSTPLSRSHKDPVWNSCSPVTLMG